MKKTKRIAIMLLTMMGVFCLCVIIPTFLEQQQAIVATSPLDILPSNTNVGLIWDYRYRKINVSNSTEWSSFDKVSDLVTTSSTETKSVSPNMTVTYSSSISGDIRNINVDVGRDISNGWMVINIVPNRRVYMGYRVKYNIETGTREKYDLSTGIVISSNSYTVKSPSHGEYKLINEWGRILN